MTVKFRPAMLAGIVLAGALSLTACSSANTDGAPAQTPSASSSASSSAKVDQGNKSSSEAGSTSKDSSAVPLPADVEKRTATCEGGKAIVSDNNIAVTIPDCASVTVTASNSVVYLGNVENLVIEGTINGVYAKSIKMLTVAGDGNIVTGTGAKPVTKNTGKGNEITVK